MATRIERDSLGEKEVPREAYYGIQTGRALENFPISGQRAHPQLIKATGYVKKAAALTNLELGDLEPHLGEAIVQAAEEVIQGQWNHQFVVDVYQAGAGVSHNMNANEVIANRAIEILGGQKGDYSLVHPNDHVNRAQSTNDVFPTASKVAALFMARELLSALKGLEIAFRKKAKEFDRVIKSARTHMQDAVPIRLGQEFAAYAVMMSRNQRRLERAMGPLRELNLGGTAAGTSLNADPRYVRGVVDKLSQLTGLPFQNAENLVESTMNPDAFAELSGALRLLALNLIKISNDLILMSSGPRTGFDEINLPALQPGSSIMPGKVNPVMAEVLNMVCYQVVGNDLAIAMATQAGQMELNVAMPLMTHNLLQSLEILKNVIQVFSERCVRGITVNEERCRQLFEESLGLATVLNPYIGYQAAAQVAQEALAKGRRIKDVILEKGLLPAEELEVLLSPERMTGLAPVVEEEG